MKKLFLCIIASTALMGASAQKQLKTAQENNPFGYNEGKATYTYYEGEDGAKVKDGNFHATGKSAQRNLVGTETSTSIDVKGSYKDGLMNGTWNYTAVVVDYGDNPCYSFTTKMSLNYNNGVPHGSWTYSVSAQKARDIILVSMFPHVYKWGPYKTVTDHTGSMTVTFENGIIRKIESSFPHEKLSGLFTKDGRPEGVWTFTASSGESGKRTFKHGFDVSGNSNEENQLLSQYLNGTLSVDDLAKHGYGIKNRPMTDLYAYTFYYKFYEYFYNDGFCRNFLTGDKSLPKDELFGSFDRLWPITYRDWSPLKNHSFQQCKEQYEEDLKAFDIREEDKVRIREELQKVEKEIELKSKKEEILDGLFNKIKECDALVDRCCKEIVKYEYSSDKPIIQDSAKVTCILLPKFLPYGAREFVSNVINKAKQNQEPISIERMKLGEEVNYLLYNNSNVDYYTYDFLVSKDQKASEIIKSIYDLNFMRDIEYVWLLGDIYHTNMVYETYKATPIGVVLFLEDALRYIECWSPYFNEYELASCIIDGASKMTGDQKELAKKYKSVRKQPEEVVRLLLSYNDNKGLDLFEKFLTKKKY